MASVFGHEKLRVYQKGIAFAVIRSRLLAGVLRRVAACDHLDRAAESIPVNIAHASSSWSPKDRVVYLGHANGSALECAACLDVLVAKGLLVAEDVYAAKAALAEIVSMLIRMQRETVNRVQEACIPYGDARGILFSHERLGVYQAALRLVAWVERESAAFTCSSDLLSKLDKSTTSTVLNIAEGNGRFSGIDHARFLATAHRATIQSASLIDLATLNDSPRSNHVDEGRELLRRIGAMLTSLTKVVRHDS